jgi:thioredoxin-related protein
VFQILIAVAVFVVALAVGVVLRRRRTVDAPTQPVFSAPAQIDRADFAEISAPWLVAVFSSASCTTCADVVAKAKVLSCAEVGVVDVEYSAAATLHRKYHVDAVPIAVIADQAGVVRASFVGPMTATDLWAAVAEARHPGSSPEPHLGHET